MGKEFNATSNQVSGLCNWEEVNHANAKSLLRRLQLPNSDHWLPELLLHMLARSLAIGVPWHPGCSPLEEDTDRRSVCVEQLNDKMVEKDWDEEEVQVSESLTCVSVQWPSHVC